MQVIWTESAGRDLVAIGAYIARDNPRAAERIIHMLGKAGDGLVEFPNRGRPGRHHATRELVVPGTPCIIVYTARGDTVGILRVLHGAQRWPDAP